MEYKHLAQSDVNPVPRPLSLDECLRTRVHVRDCKTDTDNKESCENDQQVAPRWDMKPTGSLPLSWFEFKTIRVQVQVCGSISCPISQPISQRVVVNVTLFPPV